MLKLLTTMALGDATSVPIFFPSDLDVIYALYLISNLTYVSCGFERN